MAGTLGTRRHLPRPRRRPPPQVVRNDNVPLPLRGLAHRPLVRYGPLRRPRPLPPNAGLQRPPPHRLRRLRTPRRKRRHLPRHPPLRMDNVQCRKYAPPAPLHRRHLRLEPRNRLLPPRLLPLEPVVLHQTLRTGPRLPRPGPRRLVPLLPNRPRQRTGTQRPLRTLRHPHHPPRLRTVVLPHHRLRRRTAQLRYPPRLARQNPHHAAQLDWTQRGRGNQLRHLRIRPGHPRNPHLHHPHRHHLRRYLPRPRPRTPPRGTARHRRPPRRRHRLHPTGPRRLRNRPPRRRPRKNRRLHRRLRPQPTQRRTRPHLHRRLCPHHLRHRRRNGRPRPRRPRLRLRPPVPTPHPHRHRTHRMGRQPPPGRLHRPRLHDQQRPLRRHDRHRRNHRHRQRCGTPRLGTPRHHLPPPRLAHLPTALLGNPHPYDLLRPLRHPPRAGNRPPRPPPRGRRLPSHRPVPPRHQRRLRQHPLPPVRRPRPPRNRYYGHLYGLVLVYAPLLHPPLRRRPLRTGRNRRLDARPAVHRRRRTRRHAPPLQPLLHQSPPRSGTPPH